MKRPMRQRGYIDEYPEPVPEFLLEKIALKFVLKVVGIVIVIGALIYPLDWAVWRVRVARGGGMRSVQVDLLTVAELKGGKEDYYPDGTMLVPCSESLYPQEGNKPCWWLERHPQMVSRY